MRGVMSRSTAGSSARFRNRTARRSAPVRSKSSMKTRASSCVMPIAAKTTPNGSWDPRTFAWRAICSATSLCGRPAPEKSGSFWPRTSVLSPSIVEMPVWMNSAGCSREYGLIAAPMISTRFSGTIGGPAISVIVRYSVGISHGPQFLEFLIHLRERLRKFLVELRLVLHPRQKFPRLQGRDVLRRHVQLDRLLAEVRILLDRADDLELPLRWTERVDGVVGVLLEENLPDHPGHLEGQLLV